MATVVNERDVLMAAAPARVVNVVSPGNVTPLALRGISLAAPTAAFRIATNGDPSPSAVTITATLKGIDVSATVTWAVTVGTGTLTGTGLSRTLAYANMTSDFVTITASVVVGGLTYTDQLSFMKLHDGSVGGEGTRGSLAVARAITGTSWSNTEALAALTAAGATSAISTDTCTLYNASVNYAEMRRYDGTNWVTVGSSMPGSVMMNGSITTEKLLVTGLGIALNSDPNTQDVTAWSGSGISVISDTTAPNGSSALQCVGQGTAVLSRRFPLDSTQSYRVRTWAKQVSGTSSMYLAVAFYDAAGTLISGSSSPSGWADHGDYHYYGLVGVSAPGTWTEYSASFGADEVKGIPAGAKFASLGLISNFSAAGTQLVSGMICHLKTRGEMVVKGSLTADLVDTRGLTVRNENGDVLLDASGDSVPPWVTEMSAADAGGVSLLRPVTNRNTRELRNLRGGNLTSVVASADDMSVTVTSLSQERWSAKSGLFTVSSTEWTDTGLYISASGGHWVEIRALVAMPSYAGGVKFRIAESGFGIFGSMIVTELSPDPGLVGSGGVGIIGASSQVNTIAVEKYWPASGWLTVRMPDVMASFAKMQLIVWRVFMNTTSFGDAKLYMATAVEGEDILVWSLEQTVTRPQGQINALKPEFTVVGIDTVPGNALSRIDGPGAGDRTNVFSVTLKQDGTFSSVCTSNGVTISSSSGAWSSPGITNGYFPGNDYSVRFNFTPDAGYPQYSEAARVQIVNPTSGGPQPLSSDRTFSITVSSTAVGGYGKVKGTLAIITLAPSDVGGSVIDNPTIDLEAF